MLSEWSKRVCLLLLAGVCILSLNCARREAPLSRKEAPPPPPETNPAPATVRASRLPDPPANAAEVASAVERVFKDAVTTEVNRHLYFVVGDFNGDHSQDLAVVVKPAPGKLPEINDELASWLIGDPIRAAMPPSVVHQPSVHTEVVRRERVQVNEGNVLLAVIHGFESDGWRNPQATQTYLLKDAAGGKMTAQSGKQVFGANDRRRVPQLYGDVIAQTIGGQPGFLYYNGAKYAWYDPRSFKPDPPKRLVHGGASGPMK